MTNPQPATLRHVVSGRGSGTREVAQWKRVYALLTVLGGASGSAAIVLPFTWGVSPLDALDFDLHRLLVPAFLMAPLITAASFRWLRAGVLSPIERHLAVFVSVATALSTIAFIALGVIEELPATLLERTAVLAPGLVLLGAGRFISSAVTSRDNKSIAAMQVAFAANSTLCLIVFAGEWQIGAWFTLATVLSYGLQIVCTIGWANAARLGHSCSTRLA